MRKALDNTLTDFGSEIIPALIDDIKVFTYVFDGYWEDIGTIKSFYEANINLASINPVLQPLRGERPDLHAPARPSSVQDQLQHHLAVTGRRGKHHHERQYRQLDRGDPHHHRERRQPRRRGLHGSGLLRNRGREGSKHRGAEHRDRPGMHHQEGHHRQERAHRRQLQDRDRSHCRAGRRLSRNTPSGMGSSSSRRGPSSIPAPSSRRPSKEMPP